MPSLLLTHDFPLRPGVMIRLTLPVDLTAREAARFSRFVNALVMDDVIIEAVIHAGDCNSGICEGECNG